MSRIIVASAWVWSHYPGMRAGRLYAGKPDLTKLPNSETHVVDGPDAAETLCGLSRTPFENEFPEPVAFGGQAVPCATCRPEAAARS